MGDTAPLQLPTVGRWVSLPVQSGGFAGAGAPWEVELDVVRAWLRRRVEQGLAAGLWHFLTPAMAWDLALLLCFFFNGGESVCC